MGSPRRRGRPVKSLEGMKRRWAQEPLPDGRLRPREDDPPEAFDAVEKLTLVVELFCQGHPVGEAVTMLKEQYGEGLELSRPYAFQLVHRAASLGWITFTPPQHRLSVQAIVKEYPWLQDVRVVRTASPYHVAARAAHTLRDLIREHENRDEVHLGIAGGFLMRQVASWLSDLLVYTPQTELPRKIVIHSLGAGSDEQDPSIDPLNFMHTFFAEEPDLLVDTSFVPLRTPAAVSARDVEFFRNLEHVRYAFGEAHKLDIVVTSGALWTDPHSSLRQLMERDPVSMDALESAGCVGDMLWRPLGPAGPIDIETRTRAFTLLELDDLSDMIDRGKHVVLTLGPCGGCNRPKGRLLSAILGSHRPLVTHLVTDSRTARELEL